MYFTLNVFIYRFDTRRATFVPSHPVVYTHLPCYRTRGKSRADRIAA